MVQLSKRLEKNHCCLNSSFRVLYQYSFSGVNGLLEARDFRLVKLLGYSDVFFSDLAREYGKARHKAASETAYL